MHIYINRRPGQTVHDVPPDQCGTPAVLFGVPGVGDAIRLPRELGGQTRSIIGVSSAPCPKCSGAAPVRHYQLDGAISVAECEVCGFVWYQRTNRPGMNKENAT